MAYLSRDELDKYLKNLAAKRNDSSTSVPPSPASEAKGETPSQKSNASRSPTTSSTGTGNDSLAYNTAKNDLVYPMQQMSLNTPSDHSIDRQANSLKEAVGLKSPPAHQQQYASPTKTGDSRDAFEASLTGRRPGPPPRPKSISKPANYRSPSSDQTPSVPAPATPPKSTFVANTPHNKPVNTQPVNSQRVSVPNPLYSDVRCSGCGQTVTGTIVTALGKKWHASCFVCSQCGHRLEHSLFFEKDGQPYCKDDYTKLFSRVCDYCHEPIQQKAVSALGKWYHEGHFMCHVCKTPFDENSPFMVHDGHPYCEKDYLTKFGRQCQGCHEYIQGEFVNALGGDWHKQCFVCTECRQPFPSQKFHVRNNRPYCERHALGPTSTPTASYPPSTPAPVTSSPSNPSPQTKPSNNPPSGKQCHRCRQPIEGRASNAFGYDYHPNHFQCSQCDRLLSVRVPGMWQANPQGELVCKMCARAT
ncbi:LIM domain-containing protein [Radiomyces spectabilis]|uniref:LIM domain-containing protein n=1 Tax=Radiomyces spectabilis TaxID=64574 RepID=UPI00221F3BCD|nr:LIM domain-containing protein [Radiomyces spectabilis]KAI8374526.1 LIM domain-containing protein [Radiomyces spectabilis]